MPHQIVQKVEMLVEYDLSVRNPFVVPIPKERAVAF
jgi:hypothetical protein